MKLDGAKLDTALARADAMVRGDAFEEGAHPRGPGGEFAKAGAVAEKHGFSYSHQEDVHAGEREGHHVWKHPGGAELRLRRGGIGRSAGDPVAVVKTGPDTSRSHQHQWPETAVRGALKKAGFEASK